MPDLVIDISHWQSGVNFDKIKAAGIVGVIHKATESTGYIDDCYHERAEAAVNAGLLFGAYHFLRPGDMGAQARHFVETAGEIDIYAADHEDSTVLLDDLKDFLAAVEDLTGKKAVVYSGNVIKEQVGNSADPFLAEHRLWLAHYSSSPSWPTKIWPMWWLWQYTDQGAIAGVDGDVDVNRYDGTAEQLTAEWVGAEPEPFPPEPEPEPEVAEVVITISVATRGVPKIKVVVE